MMNFSNNGQKPNLIALAIIGILVVCGVVYMSKCNNGDLNEGLRKNTYELSKMRRLLTQLTSDNKQLVENQNSIKDSVSLRNSKLTNSNNRYQSNENSNKKLENGQQKSFKVNDDKNDAYMKAKKVESDEYRKLGNGYTGKEWEEVLSFLHMDTHGLCEDIFKAGPGQGYKEKLTGYYDIVKEHDEYLKSMNLTRQFTDFDGHTSNYIEETYVLWSLVQLPFVKTVCETGFNAGHSSHLWLSTNKNTRVYAFDIAGFPSAKPMSAYLQKKFPDRLTVTWGDSTKTLPRFIEENPEVKCDLMIVDGGHEYDIAQKDILNFKKMNRGPKNILVIDNYPDRRFGNKHARAWEQFKRRGEVLEIFQCHYEAFRSGFTFGRFLV